ncbi:YaiO family outer membrane beta-barrel protein [Comamonas piscis]|uniref:YaiO family outer membrane beta-barrel protein n=1 Tax=Comamonas piscis TaxID=1562974 RepID=A0A7G5ECF2_9BURK|nr:YaiO family outer membrane beta-barrel protein [Comamonas piscis]QMV71677.1 YaiO family outer membrane beta-barrel protein [Comamonas piscis]WSO34398.1 YaiO family outer membrane beta-barrel protein [Comamonas piscis]
MKKRTIPTTLALSAAALLAPALALAQAQAADATPGSTMAAPAAPPAADEAPAADFEPGRRGRVDIGAGFSSLTGGNSNWNDEFVRGNVGLKPGTILNWELSSQRHFDQRGTVGALSLTQTLSPWWYMSVGGSSGSADFQNKYRGDIAIYRKWTESQQWVTGLALMKSASRDGIHRDTGITASVAYYSANDWVGEGGVVYNKSNPGSVEGYRGFAALTMGREKQHYFTARIDHGKEGYLPTGAIASGAGNQVGFQSTELSLQWRQWLGKDWGYLVGGEFYRNPYYNRKGVSAAVFFDF